MSDDKTSHRSRYRLSPISIISRKSLLNEIAPRSRESIRLNSRGDVGGILSKREKRSRIISDKDVIASEFRCFDLKYVCD